MLKEGEYYTRQEIHILLGGGIQDYLPHKDGKVLCGCLTKDLNPDVPDVVLIGHDTEIYQLTCDVVYQHFYESYYGSGKSVYSSVSYM